MSKVVTGKVRFSYLNVFEPKAMEGQEPKYSVALLIPKSDTATVEKIKKAIEDAKQAGARDKWKGKVPSSLKVTLYDGDGERPNGGEYGAECKGHYVLNTSSKQRPGVVDKDLNHILDPDELYSGCYGRASVVFYAYDAQGSKGVGCGLQNLQKLSDGESLGGKVKAEDDFGGLDDLNDFLG